MNPQTHRCHSVGLGVHPGGCAQISTFRLFLYSCVPSTNRGLRRERKSEMLSNATWSIKKNKGCCITRNSKRLKSHLNVCWRTGYMYHAVQINTPGDEENINMPKGYGRP